MLSKYLELSKMNERIDRQLRNYFTEKPRNEIQRIHWKSLILKLERERVKLMLENGFNVDEYAEYVETKNETVGETFQKLNFKFLEIMGIK